MSTLDVRHISKGTDPRDELAKEIVTMWDAMNFDRRGWLDQGLEARKYATATSTNDTEVGGLPWKNKTTIPKLAQIADNLQSYYMAALLPNDEWMRFEGSNEESHKKAEVVETYMRAKLRMSEFRKSLEQIVKDWIIYGNAYAGVTWHRDTTTDLITGQEVVVYEGPRVFRVSPLDVVMDKKAPSFAKSPIIRRTFVPVADILTHNETQPDMPYDEAAVEKVKQIRQNPPQDWIDFYKEEGWAIDGFQSYEDYLDSQYVELLEFYGDMFYRSDGTVQRNRVLVIADKSFTLYDGTHPNWSGVKPFAHSGWRLVPDNLYGQGPLDNLVGMQYRCDHLENLKADTFDQIVHPVVIIKGDEVEDFEWGPGATFHTGVDGDVDVLRPDASVLQANNEIGFYHAMMEQMAGSPKESMGFRTPGEKTAFEVQTLQAGADRMFQDKLNRFEAHIIEPILGIFFEMLMRNLSEVDVVKTFNADTGALEIMDIRKEHVLATGNFRAVGSKHFAARNKRLQEMRTFMEMGATNHQIGNHMSGLQFAKAMEEEFGYERHEFVGEFKGLQEMLQAEQMKLEFQQKAQQAAQQGEEQPPPEGEVQIA